MRIEISTPGLRDVIAELSKYPASVGRKHFRMALNAAAGLTKQAATVYMPKDTGAARRSLRVKVVIPAFSYNVAHQDKPARATVGVGRGLRRRMPRKNRYTVKQTEKISTSQGLRWAVQGPSTYLHFIEKGSKSHLVRAVNGRVLSSGKATFGRRATIKARGSHPMQNAWRQTNSLAANRMLSKISQGLEVEAALAYQKSLRAKRKG